MLKIILESLYMVKANIMVSIEDGLGAALSIFRQRRVRPLKR